ncbi:hypothetical protein Q3W71_15455 [Micromonospora sp. C28SCA-DRY-2]|uniref:hypothetical protein n=1 Tax=Micromonospora sp. C28SCA-DRY-2 TaxID=3059522 RepID=UPI002674A591|nr:hypothetical protein [Micromonospora sp. C28SCA-DRY-2]MDO3703066.1 hypothetical protein [Micromonospora sp. C28SCA-DRY-2]
MDGRRFQLTGPLDLSAPFTSVVEVTVAGRLHEFTAGSVGLADDLAAELGVTDFDEELAYQGGTLLTARVRSHDPQIRLDEERLVAAWRGRRYCFLTQLYGGSTADLLAVLRTLRITEHDDGLTVRPQPRAGSRYAAPATVLKQVPGLGLLDMTPLTAERTRQLPSWRGLATGAGELFRDTLSDGKPYFVLAAADAWVTVLPLADTVVDRVPDLVSRLRVQLGG